MKRHGGNTQLKLLFYIAAIAFGVYYVGTKFNLIEFQELIEQKKEEFTEKVVEEEDQDPNITATVSNSTGQAIQLDLEVAQTDSERAQGLMYRKVLGEYQGMLFVYDAVVNNSFWMKNTLIPLDILFLSSDGEVVYIMEDVQPCEADPCPVYQSLESYRYAIEVNGGWSEENKVDVGATFELPEITSGS